mmetsp:Transcript_1556/g.3128  ORF Transcript_1556/g.3128 Transcript_1556/m.3128 type:complete len:97 (-) Transcript_1556:2668-2958(-)
MAWQKPMQKPQKIKTGKDKENPAAEHYLASSTRRSTSDLPRRLSSSSSSKPLFDGEPTAGEAGRGPLGGGQLLLSERLGLALRLPPAHAGPHHGPG